ncbi:MAG: beta-eliminating lyase-related protein [Candidatus Poribacteria bacterium]|nr:beta-eliminating lyase-related protein [Candidatus Poribacteria bacterium]
METTNRHVTQLLGSDTMPIRDASPSHTVIFRGDGEPKTPSTMLQQLTEFDQNFTLKKDTYSLGGTVEQLEKKCAEMLGKEAAVFMPTGTLANHLAIRKLCGIKPRAIVQEQSHLYNDSGDCVTRLSNINLIPLAQGCPYFTLETLKAAVEQAEGGRVINPVGAVMVESPVRRQSGKIVPFDEMKAVTDYCREKQIGSHLDGARLYMMSGATGISPADYAALFDTVYVSLYKYFGAPFGAILAGTTEFTDGLYHDRRMFGGGLASANFAAALALQGIDGFEKRFNRAMTQARALFDEINALKSINVEPFEHGSNIFPLKLESDVDSTRFVKTLEAHSVSVSRPDSDHVGRIMLTVNPTILRQDIQDLFCTFERAVKESQR